MTFKPFKSILYENMSNFIDPNIALQLSHFGLNDKESSVYVHLLSRDEASAIEISRALQMHRQFVYNALEALEDKGLVLRVQEKHSKWKAAAPRALVAMAEVQQLRAAKLSEELRALMKIGVGQEFEVSEGNAAFRAHSLELMRKTPPNTTTLLFCGEWDKYFEHIGEQTHAENERVRIMKNISYRMVGPASFSKAMSEAAQSRSLLECRILPGLEANLVNTLVYEDTVDFEIHGEPHIGLSIKNKLVAEGQRRVFETLWNLATPA